MAFVKKGYMGHFTGLFGTGVGSTWKGFPILRSRPVRTKKGLSPKQEQASAIFNLVRSFCIKFSEIFQLTMSTATNTGLNNACTVVKEKALTGVYPAIQLDYSKIPLSVGNGKVARTADPAASSTVAKKVKFVWDADATNPKAKPDDQAIIAIYCEEFDEAVYNLKAAERHVMEAELTAHGMSGKIVHAWIAFRSFDGEISDSSYLGTVTVA